MYAHCNILCVTKVLTCCDHFDTIALWQIQRFLKPRTLWSILTSILQVFFYLSFLLFGSMSNLYDIFRWLNQQIIFWMWTTNVICMTFNAKFSCAFPYFRLYLRFFVFLKCTIECAWCSQNTSKLLPSYNAHRELYFDGSPINVSHSCFHVRSFENRW